MEETDKIKERYERRKSSDDVKRQNQSLHYNRYVLNEREELYERLLRQKFPDLSSIRLLEIGAGGGTNIHFFKKIGLKPENIFANELLPERVESLKQIIPHANIFPGDALGLQEENKFDVVFQSTVFTSILDLEFRKKLAAKMVNLTRNGGIILWYDFIFDNPRNSDVKGVPKSEVRELFKGKHIDFYAVTLAPPVGRRIGRLYPLVNKIFPFLRSHVVAVISK